MDSQFNRTITPAATLDLPWIIDTLDRVIHTVSDEPIPVAVLVVLLQGISWVHLASKMASEHITWTTTPQEMLDTLSVRFPSEHTVLYAVWSQVRYLVSLEIPISSWIADDLSTDKRVDSSNSPVPPGVSLIRSSGQLFLARDTVNEQQLFLMELPAVKFFSPWMLYAFVQLPPVEGLPTELHRMDLVTGYEHLEIFRWLQDML